jgi:hypothetical protein
MVRKGLFLMILLSVPGTLQAMPHGCSALALEGGDLWILSADKEPRPVLSAESHVLAASWSPDGREIAFSASPRTSDVATEVVIAEVSGKVIGRFKVDRAQGTGGLRFIDSIEWREPRTLVTLGDQGPHGGYMDVWRLSKDHSGAERVRRALFLGGGCSVSPSMRYIACAGEERADAVMIFDTLAGPADEDGSVEDRHYFVMSTSVRQDEFESTVEGDLTWDAEGLSLYTVRLEQSKRILTTIERNPAAAEGWSVSDREILGIDPDSRVVSTEVDAHGTLMLSTTWKSEGVATKAYSLPVAAVTSPGSSVVAHVASPAELRRPELVKVAVGKKERTFRVLDSYCSTSSQR